MLDCYTQLYDNVKSEEKMDDPASGEAHTYSHFSYINKREHFVNFNTAISSTKSQKDMFAFFRNPN